MAHISIKAVFIAYCHSMSTSIFLLANYGKCTVSIQKIAQLPCHVENFVAIIPLKSVILKVIFIIYKPWV